MIRLSLLREGEGGVRGDRRGGGRFYIENPVPGGGGSFQEGCLERIGKFWGGGR